MREYVVHYRIDKLEFISNSELINMTIGKRGGRRCFSEIDFLASIEHRLRGTVNPTHDSIDEFPIRFCWCSN